MAHATISCDHIAAQRYCVRCVLGLCLMTGGIAEQFLSSLSSAMSVPGACCKHLVGQPWLDRFETAEDGASAIRIETAWFPVTLLLFGQPSLVMTAFSLHRAYRCRQCGLERRMDERLRASLEALRGQSSTANEVTWAILCADACQTERCSRFLVGFFWKWSFFVSVSVCVSVCLCSVKLADTRRQDRVF